MTTTATLSFEDRLIERYGLAYVREMQRVNRAKQIARNAAFEVQLKSGVLDAYMGDFQRRLDADKTEGFTRD